MTREELLRHKEAALRQIVGEFMARSEDPETQRMRLVESQLAMNAYIAVCAELQHGDAADALTEEARKMLGYALDSLNRGLELQPIARRHVSDAHMIIQGLLVKGGGA